MNTWDSFFVSLYSLKPCNYHHIFFSFILQTNVIVYLNIINICCLFALVNTNQSNINNCTLMNTQTFENIYTKIIDPTPSKTFVIIGYFNESILLPCFQPENINNTNNNNHDNSHHHHNFYKTYKFEKFFNTTGIWFKREIGSKLWTEIIIDNDKYSTDNCSHLNITLLEFKDSAFYYCKKYENIDMKNETYVEILLDITIKNSLGVLKREKYLSYMQYVNIANETIYNIKHFFREHGQGNSSKDGYFLRHKYFIKFIKIPQERCKPCGKPEGSQLYLYECRFFRTVFILTEIGLSEASLPSISCQSQFIQDYQYKDIFDDLKNYMAIESCFPEKCVNDTLLKNVLNIDIKINRTLNIISKKDKSFNEFYEKIIPVTQARSEITEFVGWNIIFECPNVLRNGTKVAWYKNNLLLNNKHFGNLMRRIGYKKTNKWLQIRDLHIEDTGTYICSFGRIQQCSVLLLVKEYAHFFDLRSPLAAMRFSTILLTISFIIIVVIRLILASRTRVSYKYTRLSQNQS